MSRGGGGRGGRGGGRGRGRGGGGSGTFTLDAMGLKPSEAPVAPVIVQPPPAFPIRTYLPLPLRTNDVDEYLVNLKQDIRTHMRGSKFFIQQPEQTKRIVKYSDKYESSKKLSYDPTKEIAWGKNLIIFWLYQS